MTEFFCDAVLLDMDGTLVDSTECVERHWRLWAERHSLDLAEILRISHGCPTLETMRRVAPHLATAEEAAAMDNAEAEDTAGVVPVTGALAFVEALPPDRWAVVTSANQKLARKRLAQAGFPIPEVLITVDEIRQGKPHPEGYLLAASLLNVPPEKCVVMEDTPPGIRAAQAAGMPVVGIATTYACSELHSAICVRDFSGIAVRQVSGNEACLKVTVS